MRCRIFVMCLIDSEEVRRVVQHEWDKAVKKGPAVTNDIIFNTVASGIAFYLYNEFAFAFTAKASRRPTALRDGWMLVAKLSLSYAISAELFRLMRCMPKAGPDRSERGGRWAR